MIKFIEYQEELERIKEEAESKLRRLAEIEQAIKEQESALESLSGDIKKKLGKIIEEDKFLEFFKKPYVTIPHGKNKVLVAVPKFIKGFQVGWLWKETDNFYIYQLDQYSSWLGDVPKDLLNEIDIKKDIEGIVQGETIFFDPSQKEIIKKKLGYHIKEIEENQARIIRGHVFDVIAEIIENGCLPFKPTPVSKEDIRKSESKIELRPYQKEAYDRFLETGAVGIYHPTGSGKSFISLYAMDTIKGNKLIIVPTRTLAEQWSWYIETYIPHIKNEIKITTYQGYRNNDEDYALTIYDECLASDTEIYTDSGLKQIKDIKIGDRVLSWNGRKVMRNVTNLFSKTSDTIDILFDNGRKIKCSKSHPFYTTRGIIKAKDLNVSEDICICGEVYEDTMSNMPETSGFKIHDKAQKKNSWGNNRQILLQRLFPNIFKSEKLCSTQNTSYISRTQPEHFTQIPLVEAESTSMARISEDDVQEIKEREQFILERWNEQGLLKSISISGNGKVNALRNMWQQQTTDRHTPYQWKQRKQYSREYSNLVSFLSRKPASGAEKDIVKCWFKEGGLKTCKVVNIEASKREKIYDIEVEDTHNFFANGVLVGNCQRLPADSFSRLAVINTKYRIGLSASPHREDGRESYIFALTGFPVGLNWREYMETVGKSYHPIFVHTVRSTSHKIRKAYSLLDMKKKTFIFCDTIELGKKIASEFGIPYIYGKTDKRLKEIEDNRVIVISRVGDLGISVKDLERIIEVDFLFGSRQQELQRTGRLMHSEAKNIKHDIIMTEDELSKYGKRLWSLQEKGFTIKVVSG